MFTWENPKVIQTRLGVRRKFTCPSTPVRLEHYRANKEALRASGVTMSEWPKGSGKWEFQLWEIVDTSESRAESTPTAFPCPPGIAYRPFQKAGIEYMLKHKKVLLGDEMGLGKTIQVIGLMNTDPSIQRVLILCPKTLVINWQKEISTWSVTPRMFSIGSVSPCGVSIIPYSILVKADLSGPWDLIVCDEAHWLKNKDAQRTKSAYSLSGRYQLCLTGTPIPNRPIEIFTALNWLRPDMFPNFFRFAKRYANACQRSFGTKLVWDFTGASNLEELQATLRTGIMVRRLKSQVLSELPPKVRSVVVLQSDPDAIEDEKAIQLPYGEGLDKIRAVSASFEELAAVRHRTALKKVPAMIEYLTDKLNDSTEKIVVFAHHKDVIDRLSEGLSEFGVTKITGDTIDRQTPVDKFQNDPSVRIIICSILAAGIGITLTSSSTVVFAELDWVPGNVTQAEDRCHRIGQQNTVNVIHLMMDGTIDKKLAEMIIAKQGILDAALDRVPKPPREPQATPREPQATPREPQATPREPQATPRELSKEETNEILTALRYLASQCDGARQLDGHGFNRFDAEIGCSLASQESLSPRQAHVGRRIVQRYMGQILSSPLETRWRKYTDAKRLHADAQT